MRRQPATAIPRRQTGSAFALVLCAVALTVVPARAGTSSRLDEARATLEQARSQLDRVTAAWQETESRLAEAQDAAASARAQIDHLERELYLTRQHLNDRIVAAFMSGGSISLGALLTSDSIQDATDRLQYSQSVVQGDADLATTVAVQAEELRRQEDRLRRSAQKESEAAADLDAQRAEISRRVADLNALVDDLQAEFDAQEQAQLHLGGSVIVIGSGAIQTCPVAGNTSFVDSFGWPRSDGRTHQGTDLIAAYGTPVVAVAPGSARNASNSLGGNAVVLQHTNGDWTYYAHLSSFGSMGPVSAGTVIGYVGSTGNTSVNHLHFEFHPNGGAAVDAYQALLAVC